MKSDQKKKKKESCNKCVFWVNLGNYGDGNAHLTPIEDIQDTLGGIMMDLFPEELLDGFFGISATDQRGRHNYTILRDLLRESAIDLYNPSETHCHPLLATSNILIMKKLHSEISVDLYTEDLLNVKMIYTNLDFVDASTPVQLQKLHKLLRDSIES